MCFFIQYSLFEYADLKYSQDNRCDRAQNSKVRLIEGILSMVPKIFDLKRKIVDQFPFFKKRFGLGAVKAEFESEGSTFRDLIRLRRLTAQKNIPLFLKIGGVGCVALKMLLI
jgi:hypothetical protein